MEEELESVDNVIEMYYMNLIQLQNQINSLNSDLANATSCQLAPYAYCAGVDLSGMNLSGMNLTGINLRSANLQNTTFDYATLDGADLRSIVAMNATFIHTGMNDTYLQNAEFYRVCSIVWTTYVYCGTANLTNADLRYSVLLNWTWALVFFRHLRIR